VCLNSCIEAADDNEEGTKEEGTISSGLPN